MALLVNGRAAPVPSACFAGIVRKRPVPDGPIRHIKPVVIKIHLHPCRGHPIMRRPTIILVTTARTLGIIQMRVDVVGFRRKPGSHREYGYQERRPETHGPLPSVTGPAALVRA